MIAYRFFIGSIAYLNLIGMLGAYQAPKITDLGLGTEIFAVNEKGQIAFTATISNTVDHQAVLWDRGIRTTLGFLAGDTESWAGGMNNRGQVVGWSTGTCFSRAFVWQDGIMMPLGGCVTQAYGINNRGQIVGWSIDRGAVMWQDGKMIDLGIPRGSARAINERGQIVGDYEVNGITRPFLWENGHITDLGVMLPDAESCGPKSINNHTQVVGWCFLSSGFLHAFLWDKGIMTALDRPSGIVGSFAHHINDRAEIVGFAYDAGFSDRAVMWKGGTLIDLTAAIAPSVWSLVDAYDVNERGQIVGLGNIVPLVSGFHGFLLDID